MGPTPCRARPDRAWLADANGATVGCATTAPDTDGNPRAPAEIGIAGFAAPDTATPPDNAAWAETDAARVPVMAEPIVAV